MPGDISNELRETISTFAVLQSVATDTGHTLKMTGELISWVRQGLVAKYGFHLEDIPDKEIRELMDPNNPDGPIAQWGYAVDTYASSHLFWGVTLKICREVAQVVTSIAISEDMLDYQLLAQSIGEKMQIMMTAPEEQEELKRGYGNGNKQSDKMS
jgi:hypothetical protein